MGNLVLADEITVSVELRNKTGHCLSGLDIVTDCSCSRAVVQAPRIVPHGCASLLIRLDGDHFRSKVGEFALPLRIKFQVDATDDAEQEITVRGYISRAITSAAFSSDVSQLLPLTGASPILCDFHCDPSVAEVELKIPQSVSDSLVLSASKPDNGRVFVYASLKRGLATHFLEEAIEIVPKDAHGNRFLATSQKLEGSLCESLSWTPGKIAFGAGLKSQMQKRVLSVSPKGGYTLTRIDVASCPEWLNVSVVRRGADSEISCELEINQNAATGKNNIGVIQISVAGTFPKAVLIDVPVRGRILSL